MFKRTLIEAFKWSVKWYFSSISSAVATFFIMEKYFEFERLRSIKYGIAIFTLTMIFRVIVKYLQQIDNLERKINEKESQIDLLSTRRSKSNLLKGYNHYGEIILILKNIFSNVHNVRRGEEISNEHISGVLIQICNNLKHIFEKRIPDNTYSVCIKILTKENGEVDSSINVLTLCRDETSHYERKGQPSVNHKIIENTCFNEILYNIDNPIKSFYYNDNLPQDKYYKNSSFKTYGPIPEGIPDEERSRYWTLPYMSEIVLPIAPTLHPSDNRRADFYGYLCVDCNEISGFHKKYDVGMLQGVADGLSDLIKLWKFKTN
jgi:hypothetical protein